MSVGGATGLNTGMQYASEQILKSKGYDKHAKQYEVTGESVATDLLINSLMFGGARYLGSRQNKLDQDVDAEINQLNSDDFETRNDALNDALVKIALSLKTQLCLFELQIQFSKTNTIKT